MTNILMVSDGFDGSCGLGNGRPANCEFKQLSYDRNPEGIDPMQFLFMIFLEVFEIPVRSVNRLSLNKLLLVFVKHRLNLAPVDWPVRRSHSDDNALRCSLEKLAA
ncbi:MAG: hypothetical protein HOC33_04995 [Alphaproteobacteria bacterium]|nr:hypothetical protein [Alphaproteobacteria bacterium]MBT4543184.1 hypothetical protein [Alphaproteobacteria bacterium]